MLDELRLCEQIENANSSDWRKIFNNTKRWARLTSRLTEIGVPPRYMGAKMADFKKSFLSLSGKSLYIVGKPGLGKTHLMIALALRHAILDSKNDSDVARPYARFISVPNLLAKIKSTFDKNSSESEEEVFNEYANAQWLYLDDFGVEQSTDWTFLALYRIIDHRWNQQYPIIVSGNKALDKIAGGFSERIASRLMGMADIIELQGNDRREKK